LPLGPEDLEARTDATSSMTTDFFEKTNVSGQKTSGMSHRTVVTRPKTTDSAPTPME
jgi:hypothetical protein